AVPVHPGGTVNTRASRRSLELTPAVRRIGLAALIGLVGLAIAAWFVPTDTGFAWLFAHRQATGIAFGALFWLAISDLAPMRWCAASRPIPRALGALLLPVAIGWLPVLVLSGWIYPWAGAVDSERIGWLSVPAFALRTGVVLGLWSGLAWFSGT